ncbi:MAG: FMN-dependent NADH-azoreductase [Steroidobacteraceae bacterium]
MNPNKPTLLAIQASPRFDYSTSRKLTAEFIRQWRATHPGGSIAVRDLVETSLPFVDLPWILGAFSPPATHSPEAAAAIRVSDELVAELKSADRVIVGTPMYNFSIPARLKAWIDHVVRVGVTVSADNKGLLTGKSADVIIASGGDFSPGSPVEKYNQASGYLRQLFAYIGITDVNIVLAAGARAGTNGETALEHYGDAVAAAAIRDLPVKTVEAA